MSNLLSPMRVVYPLARGTTVVRTFAVSWTTWLPDPKGRWGTFQVVLPLTTDLEAEKYLRALLPGVEAALGRMDRRR